ncbi:MAG: transglutaminase family protein [Bacteroidales bacterium]
MNRSSILSITELLENCDNETFNMIVEQFKKDEDSHAVCTLKKMWFDTRNLDLKYKLEKLINTLQYKEIEMEIKLWKNSSDKDLFGLFLSLNKIEYRFDDQRFMLENFERLKNDIWLELSDNLTPLEQFSVINHMFFKEYGFVVVDGTESIMSSYMSTVLEYRKGSIYAIAMLYLIVARRLGIDVSFVNYIDYPLLAFVDTDVARLVYSNSNNYSPIIFYIDIGAQGKIISRGQMDETLSDRSIRNAHKYKDICSDMLIVSKFLENLGSIYKKRKQNDKLEDVTSAYQLLMS